MGQALSLRVLYVDFIFCLRCLRDHTKLSRVVVFITAYITILSHDYKLTIGVKSYTSLFGGREWPQVKSVKHTFFFWSGGQFKYSIYSESVLHENDISLLKTKQKIPKYTVKFSERRNSWEKLSKFYPSLQHLELQIHEESEAKSMRNQKTNLWWIRGQIQEESKAKSIRNQRPKSTKNHRANLREIKFPIYEESKTKSTSNQRPKSTSNQRPNLWRIRSQIYE